MDPLTAAALGLAGVGAIGRGVSAYSQHSGLLSDEQKNRLRELERMESINMLGGDYSSALGKQMTPVQGAMREAREQMAQDVSSHDITSGSYFRGQQEMTEAAGKERAMAEERARASMKQEEETRRAELDQLRERERLEDKKMTAMFAAMMGAAGETAPGLMQMAMAEKQMKSYTDMAGGNISDTEMQRMLRARKWWGNPPGGGS